MPEERGLYPRMPVGEQLEYFGRLHGLDADAARAAARTWLERLGLAERPSAKVEELSHGNQQRAQLAAALVHEPELLVLDEPFAGLDPLAVQTLAEVLRGEAARGAAVLFSSHQLELVEDICEDVVIIDHGRIVATGTVDALRRGSQQRRIELELEDASAWLPTRRRASSSSSGVTAPFGCSPTATSTRNRSSRRRSVPRGRRLQLRPALARGALRGAGRVMSARRAISLVAWREIRERLRSPAFLVVDA